MDKFKLNEVENILNVKFKNPELIKTALTHSSYAKQTRGSKYNERL